MFCLNYTVTNEMKGCYMPLNALVGDIGKGWREGW